MRRGIARLAAATLLALAASAAYAHDDAHGKGKTQSSAAVETAFGKSAEASQASRTVKISMSDTMRFSPDKLQLKRGETVRFVVTNNGKTMHELVLGTMDDLKRHAELMRKFPGMEHDEPYMAHVAPGKAETIAWQFTRPGDFYYGCLIPGHFEAGMIGKVTVR
ncbi:MAG TPA: cupredoxin family protein [Burkholderiales bacterium]|nr:cupredoxin family protein [Burkholderiales bacterium]